MRLLPKSIHRCRRYPTKFNSGRDIPEPVELAWMEYDLRRRVHFACELLLADVTSTLGDLTAGTVDAVVAHWMVVDGISPAVRKVLGSDKLDPRQTLGDVMGKMPAKVFLGSPLRVREGRDQATDGNGAFYALALLLSSYRYTERLRIAGRLKDRPHYMERAFDLIDKNMSSRYCQVDVERANLSRRADFLCSHRTAQVTSCQTMKARSRSSR